MYFLYHRLKLVNTGCILSKLGLYLGYTLIILVLGFGGQVVFFGFKSLVFLFKLFVLGKFLAVYAGASRRLVEQVYRLVGKIPVGNVAFAENGTAF